MKVKEMLQRVNKESKFKDNVYIGDFSEKAFELFIDSWDDQDRLVAYWIASWYCTDQTVGYKVYFFDDEPVTVSMQSGRKCSENFEWVSVDAYRKVLDYAKTFIKELEPTPKLLDIDEKFPESYGIEFFGQIEQHNRTKAIYQGDIVKVLKRDSRILGEPYKPESVLIEFSDGKQIWVETTDLEFRINTI